MTHYTILRIVILTLIKLLLHSKQCTVGIFSNAHQSLINELLTSLYNYSITNSRYLRLSLDIDWYYYPHIILLNRKMIRD